MKIAELKYCKFISSIRFFDGNSPIVDASLDAADRLFPGIDSSEAEFITPEDDGGLLATIFRSGSIYISLLPEIAGSNVYSLMLNGPERTLILNFSSYEQRALFLITNWKLDNIDWIETK